MPTQTAVKDGLSTTDAKHISYAELSALYDRIYDIADRLFKKYNPCNIHTENKKLYCTEYHKNKNYNTNRNSLCCSGCGEYPKSDTNHWSKTGCTAKCLACKLYICPTIRQQHKRFSRQLSRLERFASHHNLPTCAYFISKEVWLKQIKD